MNLLSVATALFTICYAFQLEQYRIRSESALGKLIAESLLPHLYQNTPNSLMRTGIGFSLLDGEYVAKVTRSCYMIFWKSPHEEVMRVYQTFEIALKDHHAQIPFTINHAALYSTSDCADRNHDLDHEYDFVRGVIDVIEGCPESMSRLHI